MNKPHLDITIYDPNVSLDIKSKFMLDNIKALMNRIESKWVLHPPQTKKNIKLVIDELIMLSKMEDKIL